MDTNTERLVTSMIELLKRHGYIGFVGSFMTSKGECVTASLVAPGINSVPFKMAEAQLNALVLKIFNGEITGMETGGIIDPVFFKHNQTP